MKKEQEERKSMGNRSRKKGIVREIGTGRKREYTKKEQEERNSS